MYAGSALGITLHMLSFAELIMPSKFRLCKWNTLWRICPPLPASTPTRLTASLSCVNTTVRGSQLQSLTPCSKPTHTAVRHQFTSLSCPPRDLQVATERAVSVQRLHCSKGPCMIRPHGCLLILFPTFPLQVPAATAPAHSTAENTLPRESQLTPSLQRSSLSAQPKSTSTLTPSTHYFIFSTTGMAARR